eukprot:jgi/Ulvmu1/8991/UM005_0082.1
MVVMNAPQTHCPLSALSLAALCLLQQWLCMPYLSNKSEADIALMSGVETGDCTDPDFPPTSAALFMDPEHPPATAPAGADWSRVHGHLYVPEKKLVSILPVCLHHVIGSRSHPHMLVVNHGILSHCRVLFVINGCLVLSHVWAAAQTFFWI